ncbi:MAG: alpha/beta fold hydrolase [Synechococcaceae cyanobacterium]|nr:alpha/beta fold hydrolase [Synechococcaceae cyanobacterium]
MAPRPLVLVHGLWDTPRLFRRLEQELQTRRPDLKLFAPHLPHGLGTVPIRALAQQLAALIEERFGPEQRLDLFGFSMGGVIGRTWLQEHGGHRRTHRFVCLGSPQQGTLAAQLVPRWLLAGIADMKIGSDLLADLAAHTDLLSGLDCHSLYSVTDITVFPGWRAVLPLGSRRALPVYTHRQLICHPRAIRELVDLLLAP